MSLEKVVRFKGMPERYPGIQGGMGVGISLHRLASAVSKEGWIGTISSAALDQLVPRRIGGEGMNLIEATEREVYDTRKDGGVAAINIMVKLERSYEDSVQGAVKGGANMIISGAGLPTELPSLVRKYANTNDHEINLVPIVSSAFALKALIRRSWDKQGYRPDAVVLEGPKAGGHLGWSYKKVEEAGDRFLETYDLFDVLLPEVLEVAEKYPNDFGPIPVYVAGGIMTYDEIEYAKKQGATGVQMGTRFAATKESDASEEFKQAYIEANQEDVMLGSAKWGSACGFPFRYLRQSPLAQEVGENPVNTHFCICTTLKGAYGIDDTDKLGTKGFAKNCPEQYALPLDGPCPAMGYANYKGLYTCGTEVHRVKEILPVKELIAELNGFTSN